MKHLFLITLFLFSFLKTAWALDYDPSIRLRRLSIHLTGLVPSPFDLQQLKQTVPSDLERFFLTKTDEYLQSEYFVKKMQRNLDHLFFVNPNEYAAENALDKLFADVISKNQNWDSFLIQKEYEFSMNLAPMATGMYNDLLFYGYLYKEQISPTDAQAIADFLQGVGTPSYSAPKSQTVQAKTAEQKNATAGAITTGRFFERFPTTKLNKNRKRAAAVFRIFLCDDMRPVILPNSSADLDLLLTSLDDKSSKVDQGGGETEKKHGTDPTCKSCHYKLDPLANTFNGSSRNLNKAFPGGLVYKRDDGTMVNIPVSGLGELGMAITQQPEYLQCQVRHFWNWFVGEDVPLDEKQLKTLATSFNNAGKDKNSAGRRPKDFIKYLVNSTPFYKQKKLDPSNIKYDMVRPIFKKCDNCHTNEYLAPQLSQGYPFAINKDYNKKIVGDLVKALNLDHSQKKATMPPLKAGWTLSDEEKIMIAGWIKAGAKDTDGVAQIKSTDYNIPFNSKKLSLIPSLYQTYYRYMPMYDFGENLEYLFGLQSTMCFVTSSNGAIIPRVGKGLTKKPTSEYYSFFKDCLINLSSSAVSLAPINILYSQKMFESKKQWPQHTQQEKIDHAQYIFEYLTSKPALSPTIIEKILLAVEEKMQMTAPSSTNTHMATYWISYYIMISDHFLVY